MSHFINCPITDENFIKEFNSICNDLIKANPKGFDPSLLQNANKLHFTLCVLSLDDNQEKQLIEVLSQLNLKSVKKKSLYYTFDGFESFQENVTKSRVVYIKPKQDDYFLLLKDLFNLIIKSLLENSLLSDADYKRSHITIDSNGNYYSNPHITFMNQSFIKSHKNKYSFDGRETLEILKAKILPSPRIDKLDLSLMRTDPITKKYIVVKSFNL